jgi:hypothetical protein
MACDLPIPTCSPGPAQAEPSNRKPARMNLAQRRPIRTYVRIGPPSRSDR